MAITLSNQDQWIFSSDALRHTPSASDEITMSEELQRRKRTIEYVESLYLRIYCTDPQPGSEEDKSAIICIAAVFVHRFYMRRSLKDFPEKTVAATLLFLAGKIAERPIKLRWIVNACLEKWEERALIWDPSHPNTAKHHQGKEYQRWELEILAGEEVLLEALCFDMDMISPFELYYAGMRAVQGALQKESHGTADGEGTDREKAQDKKHIQEIVDFGANMLYDAHLVPLSILFTPAVIAMSTAVIAIFASDTRPAIETRDIVTRCRSDFGLESAAEGDVGEDLINSCIQQWAQYSKMRILDPKICAPIEEYLDALAT